MIPIAATSLRKSSSRRSEAFLRDQISFGSDDSNQARQTSDRDGISKALRVLSVGERVVAVSLTLTILSLLVVRVLHAGALWRDESAVVQLAEMPSTAHILRNFQHEAFPPLFPIIVRIYTELFGSSDTVMRTFGFCAGSVLLGAFWVNSRLFRGGVPLVSLGLLSLNTTFYVWGTTIRGYGLGSALAVLTFGCVGSLLLASTSRRSIATMLICLFAVQILLYNSVLLTAIAASAVIVLLFQCRFKNLFIVVLISATALLSLLPYIPFYLRARDWNILVRGAPNLYSLWKHFEVSLGNPGYSISAIWYSIAVGLIGAAIFRAYKRTEVRRLPQWQLVWFAVIACGLATFGYYLFLRVLRYTTSAWYYLAFSCVIAAALDLIGSVVCSAQWLRWARLGFGLIALMAAPFADWSAVTERQTNVDIVAEAVTVRAGSSDLIIVVPWQFGIPFQRYYHGTSRWITIPNIADHHIHRYDLMKDKMISTHPIDDIMEDVQRTLLSGNRVWVVGGLNLPPPEEGPMLLPPAPASRFKWDNRAYTASWWQQVSVFVVLHAVSVEAIPAAMSGSSAINELENTSVTMVQGWQ